MLSLLLCCAVTQQPTSPVTYEYDEVRDASRTMIKAGLLIDEVGVNTNSVELLLMVESQGRSPGTPADKVILALVSVNDDWQYLKYHDVAVLVDGQRTNFAGQVRMDSEVLSGGGCYEASFVNLPIGLAEEIGSARVAKVAYGSETFQIGPVHKGSLANAARIARDPTSLTAILEQMEQARRQDEEQQNRMRIAREYELAFNKVEQLARDETRKRDAERVLRQGHQKIVKAIEDKYHVKEDELREWVMEYRRRN